jgi:anti-sigma B factor antagonist
MQLETSHPDPQTLVVRIGGRFDAHTVADVKVTWADPKIHNVVVDLSETTFIDSMGLAALVSGLKTTRERGGTLVLASVSEVARVILELTRMHLAFTITPTLEEAVNLVLKK